MDSILPLISFIFALTLGFIVARTVMKSKMDSMLAQGQSQTAVEIATLTERLRSAEADLEKAEVEIEGKSNQLSELRNQWEKSRDELSTLTERVSRIQPLEAELEEVGSSLDAVQQKTQS
jgi:chromosome segregation ATPase